jgi:hypothetical protein
VIDVGDSIQFQFSKTHRLRQFEDSTAFESCDFSQSTLKADTNTGGGTETLPNLFLMAFDTEGTFYFGCDVSDHCSEAGMKIQITVSIPTVISSTDVPTLQPTTSEDDVNITSNTENNETEIMSTESTSEDVNNTETSSSKETGSTTFSTMINTCNDDSCCQNLENGNPTDGNGFMEFSANCRNGGLHCVSNIGCRLCYKPVEGGKNVGNRPVCSRFGGLYNPTEECNDQACCERVQSPNESDGNGYFEFWQACSTDPTGTIHCIQEHKGCRLCYRPVNGGSNVGNRPICARYL